MYTVIMAGGSGTRFWPASRKKKPKQFLPIFGTEPMIVETCNRMSPIARDKEIIFVLGVGHLAEAGALFQGRPVHLLGEPVGRNTAPCIGLGALYASFLGCHSPMAFLPADHFIADPDAFIECLAAAAGRVQEGGIATLGIVPTRPETGYGYIKRGKAVSHGLESCYEVEAFVEKPTLARAKEYLSSGKYYWNAGIFLAHPEAILQEIGNCLPPLYEGLMTLKRELPSPPFDEVLSAVYSRLDAISFDYGIMEKTQTDLFVVPCECGWSDVGSWGSLYELREGDQDESGNLIEGDSILMDCNRVFVSNQGKRIVACLGMKDCVIVDTEDALLLADLKRTQDIGKIVEWLKKNGKEPWL
jgi:mannose-1-phosphate guanylyltransferase